MPDDELKEGASSSFVDDLAELGLEAVAVGAAAASFYRMAGGRTLARQMRRYGRKITNALNTIDGVSYNALNRTNISQHFDDFTRAFSAEPVENAFTLPHSSRVVHFARDLQRYLGRINLDDTYQEAVTNNAIRFMQQQIANMGDETRLLDTRLTNFIRSISHHIDGTPVFLGGDARNLNPAILQAYNNLKLDARYDHLFQQAIDRTNELFNQYKSSVPHHTTDTLQAILLDFQNNAPKTNSWLNQGFGDAYASIDQILANARSAAPLDRANNPIDLDQDPINILRRARQALQQIDSRQNTHYAEAFGNLRIDPFIRADKEGNVYSFHDFTDLGRKFLNFLGNTMPGHFLKLNDIGMASDISWFQRITKGTINREIADWERKHIQGIVSDGIHVGRDYFRAGGNLYRYDEAAKRYLPVQEFQDMTVVSGQFGWFAKLHNSMSGIEPERFRRQDSLKYQLDLMGQTEPTIWETLSNLLFGERDRGIYSNAIQDLINRVPTDIADRYKRAGRLANALEHSTESLNRRDLETLRALNNVDVNSIIDIFQEEDLTLAALSHFRDATSDIKNPGLKKILEDIHKNSAFYAHGGYRLDSTSVVSSGTKIVTSYEERLRTELSKELLLAAVPEDTNGFSYFSETLFESLRQAQNATITADQENRIKRIAFIAQLQGQIGTTLHASSLGSGATWNTVQDAVETVERIIGKQGVSPGEAEAADVFRSILNNQSPLIGKTVKRTDDLAASYYSEPSTIFLRKSTNPLDILSAMNESIKQSSIEPAKQTIMDAVGQFFAGRENMSEVTFATYFPYFFAHRLGQEDLAHIGAGFSNLSTGNLQSLLSTIMLKRVLPIAVGATYLEWADDTFGAITGTRFSAVATNAAANVDLGVRRGLSAVGLDQTINNIWDLVEPLQYWGGREGFYSYEQEQDYYRSGYEPMRKSRYWDFGTFNEFRGGQIEYFVPNLTRRLNSDYYNKSVYGSYWTKWSHSLLPTPTNPLSPLFYALDPYYLEEMHSEDRPYPVSGTMFAQGTPWGAILNPTIGELIKPQVKLHQDRLDGTGTDVLAIIDNINRSIHQSAMDKDQENVFILDNGNLTPALFRSYNQTTPNVYSVNPAQLENPPELGDRSQFGRYEGGVPINEYISLVEDYSSSSSMFTAGGITYPISSSAGGKNPEVLPSGSNRMPSFTGRILNSIFDSNKPEHVFRSSAIAAISKANDRIVHPDRYQRSSGVFINDSINFNRSAIDQTLTDAETVNDLINAASGGDVIHDAAVSLRLLSGIYGYGANRFMGFGDYTEKQAATSADIDSFSRSFWDASLGGLGGGVSEIGRRFIPEYRRSARENPLMNTMPDWLPERFRVGDAYSNLPHGEARLPGVGYEALHQLHPDQFGAYGALDRYAILADIAPYSSEYKLWRKIARETVQDPQLKKEMAEINKRVLEAGKVHDFYNYRFSDASVDREAAVITRVMSNGEFMIRDSTEVHKLAGIDFKETEGSKEALANIIHPGMTVQIAVDSNDYHRRNLDTGTTVNTAVFIEGQSVSEMLLDAGIAERKSGTQNAADVYAMHSGLGRIAGSIMESISHTYIPFISDKWLRIQDPIESYKYEQVYGVPYHTWSDIWGTFITPFYERAIADPWQVIKDTALFYSFDALQKNASTAIGKRGWGIAAALSNPIAFMGEFIGGTVLWPNNTERANQGKHLGALAAVVGSVITGPQNGPFGGALSWGHAGWLIGDLLDEAKINNIDTAINKVSKTELFSKNFIRSAESLKSRGKMAAIGALAGFIVGGMNKGIFNKDADKAWIPERAQERYELEDYFDRLNYIKYMGLYNKAADLAMSEEGTNLRALFEQIDQDAAESARIRSEIKELMLIAQSHNMSNARENQEILDLQRRYNELNQNHTILKGGEYTRAALLYKQAAESTMYGLRENATWMDISKALPKYERDYFTEFMKERDPEKREEILQYASPFQRRALKQVWGMDYQAEKGPDNDEYFQDYNLPNFLWDGWDPSINLNDVRAKTIKNEGMSFSDFGVYESQYRDPNVINAPDIRMDGSQDALTLQANLSATLSGLGLTGVDVRIEPKQVGPIQAVINVSRVVNYEIDKMIENIF